MVAVEASLGVATTAAVEEEVVEEEMEGVEAEVVVVVDLVPTETMERGLSFPMISWSLRSWELSIVMIDGTLDTQVFGFTCSCEQIDQSLFL